MNRRAIIGSIAAAFLVAAFASDHSLSAPVIAKSDLAIERTSEPTHVIPIRPVVFRHAGKGHYGHHFHRHHRRRHH